jgi:hypothetical protein
MLGAAAVAVKVVATIVGAVTVIVAEPVEPANALTPAYVAVTVLEPCLRLLPFTEKAAVAFPPADVSAAVPSDT